MKRMSKRLKEILDQCKSQKKMSQEEILYLLTRMDTKELEEIFAAARQVRDAVFGKKVFLYGFVYFSTYCKNNCTFCYYRRDNQKPPRYRKTADEIVETAKELKASGIHLIDLTTGDDPYYTRHPQRLAEIIRKVKEETQLPVMVSPGLLEQTGLQAIAQAGADWYALYQETHNPSLFYKLRYDQSYGERMQAKRYARELGILLEEGLLTGVGDTAQDRADSFIEMEKLQASQVRTMTFIAQEGAPFQGSSMDACCLELLNIAVMRLLFPDKLIPASLDVEGLDGLKKRLMAGANVVTSIIPPKKGYAGVANSEHDIDEGYRTVEGIAQTLQECGVSAAELGVYQQWVTNRKNMLCQSADEEIDAMGIWGEMKTYDKFTDYRCETTGHRSNLSGKESRI